MKMKQQMQTVGVIGVTMGIILFSGCATRQRIVPALLTSVPRQDIPDDLRLLNVPKAPALVSIPLVITIPKQETSVGAENAIMRRGAVIKSGSSVVISVPASLYQHPQKFSGRSISAGFGFRTDGYFNVLEQYIERGLISVGFDVKDRSKFEAKLRDLRDSGNVVRSSDTTYKIALASLQKELEGGKLTNLEFVKQAKQVRDKLLDSSQGSRNREEMTDISEVIRAAQDGDVMSDYVLQVNELSFDYYTGVPLQLGSRPEVQKVLRENPGLRIGSREEKGHVIPATLKQPWAQARFNAKLINVKTGSIDWIGEYSIESLSVLEDGIQIRIDIRKRPYNANKIIGAIEDYNDRLRNAYQGVMRAKQKLKSTYREVMKPVTYEGPKEQEESIQSQRQREVERMEESYSRKLAAYRRLAQRRPEEARMSWTYVYDVDEPIIVPDLLQPQTKEEGRRLIEHVKALGAKVTHDLSNTIKISESS